MTFQSPCLGLNGDFPWASMIMVFSLLFAFMAETIIHSILSDSLDIAGSSTSGFFFHFDSKFLVNDTKN